MNATKVYESNRTRWLAIQGFKSKFVYSIIMILSDKEKEAYVLEY